MYLFKPLTVVLLLFLAACATSAHGPRYQWAIVLGLACSLAGDVFLMLPSDRFVMGLASFLLAHLAYLAAFSAGVPIGVASALVVPFLAAVGFLRFLWPGLGPYRGPVLVYSAVIVLMVWQAWGRSRLLPGPGSTLAAVGATLFMASDGILALNRFRRPFPEAQLLVMSSYVTAQAMIALSVSTT